MNRIPRAITLVMLFIGLLVPLSINAANINIVALESGGNVVITASGSIDLTGLTAAGSIQSTGRVEPVDGLISVGPLSSAGITIYRGGAGIAPFGDGMFSAPSSGTGDTFGISSGNLVVPFGYLSGNTLDGSSTYNSATFASLGMDVGSYLYTFSNDQTLSLQVGPVPLPAAAWLFISALAGLVLAKRKQPKA